MKKEFMAANHRKFPEKALQAKKTTEFTEFFSNISFMGANIMVMPHPESWSRHILPP